MGMAKMDDKGPMLARQHSCSHTCSCVCVCVSVVCVRVGRRISAAAKTLSAPTDNQYICLKSVKDKCFGPKYLMKRCPLEFHKRKIQRDPLKANTFFSGSAAINKKLDLHNAVLEIKIVH